MHSPLPNPVQKCGYSQPNARMFLSLTLEVNSPSKLRRGLLCGSLCAYAGCAYQDAAYPHDLMGWTLSVSFRKDP